MSPSPSLLIVGLGNPEKKYEATRHNFGFLVVCYLAKELGCEFSKRAALQSFIAHATVGGKKVFLALPTTYVNNSGAALKAITRRENIALENILVVCDDLNLSFGDMRLRPEGADGGHNGLESIINEVGSRAFARLKIGIGRPAQKEDIVQFVLSDFTSAEKKELTAIIEKAAQCSVTWVTDGIHKAMNQFNTKEGKTRK